MGSLVRLLHMSCARTMALKYKLRFMAKAYKKFGSLMTCPEKGVSLYKPETLKSVRKFNLSKGSTLVIRERTWANKLTTSVIGKLCIICGDKATEMHSVRKMYKQKEKKHLSWFTVQMAAVNRKQVSLCKAHHVALH